MSILKMVNRLRSGWDGMTDLYDYINAPSKTDSGLLKGTHNILSNLPLTEMMSVKKLWFKTGGREQIHLVVSLTPDTEQHSDSAYLRLASEIAAQFEGFQSYFAVHKDTVTRHLHFVLNTVSVIDGHKFTQSKSDLHRLKQRCSDLLEQYGFDRISMKAEDMLDAEDYSECVGFDFLEIDEPIAIRDPIIPAAELEPYYGQISFSPAHSFTQHNTLSGGFNMNNAWNNPQYPVQPAPQAYPAQICENPAGFPVQPAIPSISVNTGTHYIVHMEPTASPADIAAVSQQCGQVTEQQALLAANVGYALYQKGQAAGQMLHVAVNPAPIIEIDLTGGMLPYRSEDFKPV